MRSYDFGKSFKMEKNQILSGHYYFVYEVEMTSSRTAYNFFQFAAYIGALSGLFMKFMTHFAKRINNS